MFNFRKRAAAAVVALAAARAPAIAGAQIYKGETAGVGDPVHTMFVTFANQAGKAGVEIQVNAGQTLTKSMLRGGRQEIDFFSTVPSLVNLMKGQKRMYESVGDAPAAAQELRSIAPNLKLESPIPCHAAHSRDIGED